MSLFAARANHLRVRNGHAHSRVTFVELFFDLVFVFAITQLSHGLLERLTPLGAVQTAILVFAVWWAWIDTAWMTNWLDPERAPVRMLLFALMLVGLIVSVSIPGAFGARGLAFAIAYAAFAIAPKFFMLWALKRHDAGNYRNFVRITVWRAAGAACWLAGGFVSPEARLAVWALALAIDTASPLIGFWVPGLGRSSTADWDVEGGHLAERCALFIIIALGESILITGATSAGLPATLINNAAFANAFIGSVAMWAVYFNIGAERGSRLIAGSDDPGRLARSGYTYLHVLMVAGIIVTAVGDELVLHHPGGHTDAKTAAVILGGPALYLFGNALFKWLSAPYAPLSHTVGLVLLALLAPASLIAQPLALSAAANAVLVTVRSGNGCRSGGRRRRCDPNKPCAAGGDGYLPRMTDRVKTAPTALALDTRAGWPADLRLLIERYPREVWSSHANLGAMAQFWLQRHAMFREIGASLEEATTAFREGTATTADFRAFFPPRLQFFLQQLNAHHQIEDLHYFPVFQAAEARLAHGFDVLEADHHLIHGQIDATVDAANAFLRTPANDAAAKAAGEGYAEANGRLLRLLTQHLRDEEDLIIPLILDRGEGPLGVG